MIAILNGEIVCLRWLAGLMLANGLGVSNHNFALLMWPVYVVIAVRWWSAWRDRRARSLLIAGGSLLLGMVPVLILCADDLIARGSLPGTLQSFLVGHYGSKVTNVSILPSLLWRALAMTAVNFPTPVILLAIPGLWLMRDRTPQAVYWLAIGGAFIYTIFAARYNVPDQHTFLVPAFLFLALFAAVGMDQVLRGRRGPGLAIAILVLSILAPIGYGLAPPLLRTYAPDSKVMPDRVVPYRDRFEWFLRPWRVGYDGTRRYARETLESLPHAAWLVVDTTLAAPLNYVQVAESLRQDVRLDCVFIRQDWFEPTNLAEAREAKLARGLMFAGSDQPQYLPPWLRNRSVRLKPQGHVFHVEKPHKAE